MIYSVRCDQPSFKTIEFTPGFNVVLAERTKESSKKDSRNGLGKSTFIEIIHFCLGSKTEETLSHAQVKGWTFTVEIDLAGKKYSISRNTASPGRIIIGGDFSNWPIQPALDKKTGQYTLSTRDWTKVLGHLVYGLEVSFEEYKYKPSFRSLISYFVRRNGHRGGFLSPFQYFKNQKNWNEQIQNAFMLGLAWEYTSKWQVLKDRVNVLEQIKQEARSGILSGMIGTVGELEAKKIRYEVQAAEEEKNLKSFQVHPEYKSIETECNQITYDIHNLVNANVTDQRLLKYYADSLKDEVEAKNEDVIQTYKDAGIALGDGVKKRLSDVLEFHKQIVSNRKSFLGSEIERIKDRISIAEKKIKDLSESRVKLMRVLEKHGALEEYTELQNRHQKVISELRDIEARLANLKKFDEGKSSVVIEQELLKQAARTDLTEREAQRQQAISLFNANSTALYQSPGVLSIDVTDAGYKFNVVIERSGSHGIGNMKIFCYDLMLAQLWAKKAKSPIFLIHDSIIFADVDERQRALAIELAAKESDGKGFQYICAMNSDSIPEGEFSKGFQLTKYVRKVFTDATEDGGLLGIRF